MSIVDSENEIILEKHHVHLKMTSFVLNCKKFFDCKKIPNEVWLKIMNYSNTKDLIKNLTLVCKNFNSLAKDVPYLVLKDITK